MNQSRVSGSNIKQLHNFKAQQAAQKNYNFIDKAKKAINNWDLIEGEFLINLAMLHDTTDPNDKINIISLQSFLYFKANDELLLNSVLNKANKLHKLGDKILKEHGISFVRIFFRAGSILLEKRKYFLALHSFYKAKTILEKENESEIKEIIENKYYECVREISKIVELAHNKIFAREEYIKNLRIVANSIDFKQTDDGRPYYLISNLWLTFFIHFIKEDKNDKNFDLNKVCLLNFCNDSYDKYDPRKYFGKFPGPINNYHLLDFKNFWYDPDIDHQHTNYFLKKNVKEKSDFAVVSFDTFDKLQSFFGCNYPIQRNAVIVNESLTIDVFLKRIRVFVSCDLFYKRYKNLINIKEIQFGKRDTVLDLKKKLIRCVNHEISREEFTLDLTEFRIYIPLIEDKKKETMRLIFSCRKEEFYDFSGEEIRNDNELIDNLKISPSDVVLVEMRNDSQVPWLLHLEKEIKTYKCFYCKTEIDDVIRCNFCVEYYYCSNECRSKDENHLFYHKNINSSSKKDISIEEITSIDVSKFLDNSSIGGLAGLKNLGNTCFMNSAIQCLSHTMDLTMYFLLNKFSKEINRNNKNGTKGKMAEAYYELVKELWLGRKNVISPWDFRQIFVSFSKQFAGFSQQDSQEMLIYVLDNLHEDLSRVKEKPYLEIKEKEPQETEEEASQRWWSLHLQRENSIINDLFYGQFKSELKCLKCGKISITFDPFNFLGLPIPNINFSIKLKLFNEDSFDDCNTFDFVFNEQSTVSDLKDFVYQKFNKRMNILVVLTKKLEFLQILKDNEVLSPLLERMEFEVIIWQTNLSIEDSNNKLLIVAPVKTIDETTFLVFKNEKTKAFYYPIPIVVPRETTSKALRMIIFTSLRRFYHDVDEKRPLKNFIEKAKVRDTKYIHDEYSKFASSNRLKILILNNQAGSNLFSKQICEYCGKDSCEACAFNFPDSTQVEDIFSKGKNKKFLILQVFYNMCLDISSSPTFHKAQMTKNTSISLYDCLQCFREGERLENDNAWYCPNCKSHQTSLKKMDVFKFPKNLIIQLKRFKTRSSTLGMISNQKNNSPINFPLTGLKLSNSKDGRGASYELYAVSNHIGSISSGHYTACCNNRGTWYMFDDSQVYKLSPNQVISENAYVLFYKKV